MQNQDPKHFHKCHLCGTMWSHGRAVDVSDEVYHKLHNCPTEGCDGNQRWIHHYAGEQEPHPGAWNIKQKRLDERDPGGGGGGRKEQKEEEIIEFLLLLYHINPEIFGDIDA